MTTETIATHTPGPWTAEHDNMAVYAVLRDDPTMTGYRIADLVCEDTHPALTVKIDEATANANARLMAAAPELLAALIGLVERCDGDEGVREDGSNIQTMQAHAAIEKAEGR